MAGARSVIRHLIGKLIGKSCGGLRFRLIRPTTPTLSDLVRTPRGLLRRSATLQTHFGPYCIAPLPKDQSSLASSTRLIQTSSFRTPVRS